MKHILVVLGIAMRHYIGWMYFWINHRRLPPAQPQRLFYQGAHANRGAFTTSSTVTHTNAHATVITTHIADRHPHVTHHGQRAT